MQQPNPLRVAYQYLKNSGRVAARGMDLPEGTEQVEHGKFKIWVTPSSQPYLKDTLDLLAWVDREYTTSGIPLGSGPIGVVLGARGGSTQSAYLPDRNVFWLVPKTLRDQTKATVIHEVAHWYHHNRLGVMNPEVLSKFGLALGLKKTKTDVQKDLAAKKSEIQRLRDDLEFLENGKGQLRRGQVYTSEGWDNPHLKNAPYTRSIKILSVSPKKTKLQVLNPSPYEVARKIPLVREEPTRSVAWGFLTPEDKTQLKEIQKTLDDAVSGYNVWVKSEEFNRDFDTRYEHQLNEWLPTEYAKKNVLEWWAELVTAYILHPANLTPEVKSWISSVVA